MGARTILRRSLLVAAGVLGPGAAAADPVLALPETGQGELIAPCPGRVGHGPASASASATHTRLDDPAPPRLALVAEFSGLGVVGADRIASFPDVGDVVRGEPELAMMRVGLVGRAPCARLAGALRLDLSEGLRLDDGELDGRPLAAIDRVVDDAYGVWTPRGWLSLWLGRQPVPLSRFRVIEHGRQLAGAAPFLIDRVAPERRWGLALAADVGAVALATGVFADGEELEVPLAPVPGDRAPPLDPSAGSRVLVAARGEWTPRAPVGRDHLASPPDDPWRPVPRISLGAGVAARVRDDRTRVDATLSVLGLVRAVAATAELVVSVDAEVAVGAVAEVSVLPIARAAVFGRAELDGEADLGVLGAGASWFVTPDRLNKITVFGFARRARDGDALERDGVVVALQAFL